MAVSYCTYRNVSDTACTKYITLCTGERHTICGRHLGQQLHPFEQNQLSESILHGTVDLSNLNLSASIHACIHEMCYPPGEDGSDPVSDLISHEDFSNGFKLLSEDLSSSPSGRHIGHYKAVLGDVELCTMYVTILSLPFKHGFTLRRWT
jgi:hypothetical protein